MTGPTAADTRRSKAKPVDYREPGSKAAASPFREPVPMNPMRGMFYALMAVLAIWCVAMVVMYFRAIHPAATQPSQPQPGAASAPALAHSQP
jgi:hypothetical protein